MKTRKPAAKISPSTDSIIENPKSARTEWIKECPHCGELLNIAAGKCWGCGRDLDGRISFARIKPVLIIFGLLLALSLFILFILSNHLILHHNGFVIVPKQSPGFKNTFMRQSTIIKQYNDSPAAARIPGPGINKYCVIKLEEKGLFKRTTDNPARGGTSLIYEQYRPEVESLLNEVYRAQLFYFNRHGVYAGAEMISNRNNPRISEIFGIKMPDDPVISLSMDSKKDGFTCTASVLSGTGVEILRWTVDQDGDIRSDIFFDFDENLPARYRGGQAEAVSLLRQIYAMQDRLRRQTGCYPCDGVTASAINPFAFDRIGIELLSNARYTYIMNASANSFTCRAECNLDQDTVRDIWTIDQTGKLTNISNDYRD